MAYLVFWNYSTNLLQFIAHLDYKPVSMVCDDVTNTLTVIGPRIIEQYTINGKKLHSYHFHDINKNSGQINELKTVSMKTVLKPSPTIQNVADSVIVVSVGE